MEFFVKSKFFNSNEKLKVKQILLRIILASIRDGSHFGAILITRKASCVNRESGELSTSGCVKRPSFSTTTLIKTLPSTLSVKASSG